MNKLTLHHLKPEDLPAEWVKQLPPGQRFTVTIIAEQPQTVSVKKATNTQPLFGIWQDNPVVQNIDNYVRQLRKGRFFNVD